MCIEFYILLTTWLMHTQKSGKEEKTDSKTKHTSICTYGAVTFLQWILFFFFLIVCICLVYKWPAQSRKDKCIENKDRILMHFCINWKVYKETMRNEFFVHIRIKFRLLISFHALNCVAYQKKKLREIFYGKMFGVQLKRRKNAKNPWMLRFIWENVKYAGF